WMSGGLALLTLGALLASGPGCSDSKQASCNQGQQQAALEESCTGSAKSCYAISISTSSGQEACARQTGCELSYDYMDCRGSAKRCSELSEVYCLDQIGCTWQAGSGGGN